MLYTPFRSFSPKVLQEFQRHGQVFMQSLPYTSVNVVVKNVDNPLSIDDFRSGEHVS